MRLKDIDMFGDLGKEKEREATMKAGHGTTAVTPQDTE